MRCSMRAHQRRLISSFIDIAVGQTTKTARMFLRATSWNLEEALNLFLAHQTPAEIFPDMKIWDSNTPKQSVSASVGSALSLSSLYRPPLKRLCSFEEAKSTSTRKDQWLLVNLQSTSEFASHALNQDLWSNEVVSQTIESSFVLYQVYDDTPEGEEVSDFYKIESAPPVVLLINPFTGEKMRSWIGAIEAQCFLEDLMKYIDAGSLLGHYANKTEKKVDDQVMATNFFDDNS